MHIEIVCVKKNTESKVGIVQRYADIYMRMKYSWVITSKGGCVMRVMWRCDQQIFEESCWGEICVRERERGCNVYTIDEIVKEGLLGLELLKTSHHRRANFLIAEFSVGQLSSA